MDSQTLPSPTVATYASFVQLTNHEVGQEIVAPWTAQRTLSTEEEFIPDTVRTLSTL